MGLYRDRTAVPYYLWTRQVFIEATPGNVVDYGAIEQRILADAALFQVREIAYDLWNATHIALRLQDEGATMVEFRQGLRSMAAPTRTRSIEARQFEQRHVAMHVGIES